MAVRPIEQYRPLYFLSALGAGGMAVAVFTYLMFVLNHKGHPIPTYEDLAVVYTSGSTVAMVLVTTALVLIGALTVLHLVLMAVNIAAHRRFVRTDDYLALTRSNAEVTLMAVPLSLGMTINVLFIVGALSVPGLWGYVEYLFPVALTAMAAVGVYALKIFGRYLTRILAHSGFDIEDTNHFSQVLPSFTFMMIAVGFATPASMSHTTVTAVVGMAGSFFFGAAALMWALVKLPVSFGMMLRQGLPVEAGPTLLIGIPILTMLGIAFVRIGHGVSHHFFGTELAPGLAFVVLGLVIAANLLLGLVGWKVMSRQHYFSRYIWGQERSVTSYALICPGVAMSVSSMFFISWGLVHTGLIAPLGAVHIGLLSTVGAILVTFAVIMFRLNVKLLRAPTAERHDVELELVQV